MSNKLHRLPRRRETAPTMDLAAANELLKATEARFEAAFEQAAVGMALVAPDGRWLRVNQKLCNLVDYTMEELLARSFQDITHLEDLGSDRMNMQRMLDREIGTYTTEKRYIKNGGHVVWVNLTVTLAWKADGSPDFFISIIEDITERKRSEVALREKEDTYRSLFDHMLNGLAHCRMAFVDGRPSDFLYLNVNAAFETLTGLRDVAGRWVSEVIPGIREADPGLFEIYGRVAKGGPPEHLETYIEAMGMWFSISVYCPRLDHFVAVFDVITERKQAEQEIFQLTQDLERRVRERTAALHDLSAYNRSLLEASLDPLVTIGVDGRIQDVNEATVKATGVVREELIGSDFSTYFTEPDNAKAGYEKVFAEGVVRDYNLSIKHRDGGIRSVRYNASLYRDKAGQVGGVFAAARDITDRLMAERAVARNTAILDEAGRMAKVGGWELDLATMQLLWTEATYAIHEIATDFKPTLESALGFYAPESVAIISKAVQKAIEEGKPFDEELELITAKQNRIWVRAVGKGYGENGKIARISGIFQDITARKRAEILKAIQGELAQILSGTINLMEAFSALLDAAIQLSGMDCGGVYAMDEKTGCLDLVITKNLSADFIRNSSHYEASTPNAAILMAGGPIYTTHANLGSWNTSPSNLGALAILPLVASGTVIGCLKVGSFASAEVPEAVREPLETLASRVSMVLARIKSDMAITGLNKELSDKSAEIEATNKELEAFSYSVSHDLRAPLRHLTGFVALLEQKGTLGLDEQSKHYLQIISGSARKMGELIDDLLSFSRMGRAEMMTHSVDLKRLAQEVIEEVSRALPPGRVIQWRLGDLPVATGDRAMLRLALVNLIANAVKFSHRVEAPVIEVGALPPEKGCHTLFVRDNGAGFNMKYVDKLFGLFQRLHPVDEYEGTGLGLANVRRIITRHGGKTWAEGELNKGATFYFTLPQDKEIRS